jgi:hypothetical protein
LINKSSWLHPKDSLAIDTGIALLDGLVVRLAQARVGTPGLAKKMLEISLEGVSRSGIPGSLYLRSQRILADQIIGFMEGLESAA